MRGSWGWCALSALATACGDNLEPQTCAIAAITGADPRVEAISGDGGFVAFTVSGPTGRDLFVTPTACASEPMLVAPEIDFARFCGTALLAFHRADAGIAEELWGWTPTAALQRIAFDVDPGAVRCARDARYVSIEANDRTNDMVDTVEIFLVRTADLAQRSVDLLDRPRARFTRDSTQLVYSGGSVGTQMIMRVPVDGGTAVPVTSFASQSRWEITHDSLSLIHAAGVELRRTDFAGGGATLATSLLGVSGKELDVSPDGRVAFVSGPERALDLIATSGGEVTRLVDGGVASIVDHQRGLVFYAGPPPESVGSLSAVSTDGGGPWFFGSPATIADEADDAVLVLSGGGGLSWIRAPTTGPTPVTDDVAQAAMTGDGQIIVQRTAGAVIDLIDPDSLALRPLYPATIGPFVVAPDRDWLAVASDTGDGVAVIKVPIPRR